MMDLEIYDRQGNPVGDAGSAMDIELLSGTKNNANKVFFFASDPSSTHMVLYNGQTLRKGLDYTRSGAQITLAASIEAPGVDDIIWGIVFSSISLTASAASDISNDSSVTGVKVSDALNQLDADLATKSSTSHTHAASDISNDSSMNGVKVSDALDNLKTKAEPQKTLNVTASSTDSQGQQQLAVEAGRVEIIWEFGTVGVGHVGTLPTFPVGPLTIFLINSGANDLKLYPDTGDDLGEGLNVATTIAAGEAMTFVALSGGSWFGR